MVKLPSKLLLFFFAALLLILRANTASIGQTVSQEGQTRGYQRVNGAMFVDSGLRLPIRALIPWAYKNTTLPNYGLVQVNPTDTLPYYGKNDVWVRLLLITDTSLFHGGGGTVTSVGAIAGVGISIAGTSPITSAGTFTFTNTAPDQTVTIGAGTGISVGGSYPTFTVTNTSPSTGGTVTSVGLSVPIIYSVSGTPITGAGTFTVSAVNQGPNKFYAGAVSGTTTPTFRAIDTTDMPTTGLTFSTVGSTSAIPVITYDAYGRIRAVTTATVSATGGTVTDVSIAPANGFAGSVATSTTTPAITLSVTPTIGSMLKVGPGKSITAATAGTDYQSPNLTDGYMWVGNASNIATGVAISNDATISNTGVLTLKGTGTAGTYGSASLIPSITTDAQGRVTGVTTYTFSAGASTTLTAGAGIVLTQVGTSYTVATTSVSTYTITEATTFTMSPTLHGTQQQVTLAHANDTVVFTGFTIGQSAYLYVVQDETGSRRLRPSDTTITKVAYGSLGKPAITTTSAAIDRWIITYRGDYYFIDYGLNYNSISWLCGLILICLILQPQNRKTLNRLARGVVPLLLIAGMAHAQLSYLPPIAAKNLSALNSTGIATDGKDISAFYRFNIENSYSVYDRGFTWVPIMDTFGAIYLNQGLSLSTQKYNFKDPTTFVKVFTNSPTAGATGTTYNGTTQRATTAFNASTNGTSLSGIGFYCVNNDASGGTQMGQANVAGTNWMVIQAKTSNLSVYPINSASNVNVSNNVTAHRYWWAQRLASNSIVMDTNGVLFATNTAAALTANNNDIYISCYNQDGTARSFAAPVMGEEWITINKMIAANRTQFIRSLRILNADRTGVR